MTNRIRLLGFCTAAVMLIAAAAPTQAFTQELTETEANLLECLILVFSDPARHIVECGVGASGAPQSLNFHTTGDVQIICPMYFELSEGKCIHSIK